MHGRGFFFLFAGMGAFVARAQAQPITHPIWAGTPDASVNDAARAQFEAAAKKRGLGPVEIVAMPAAQTTPTTGLFGEGMTALRASNLVLAAALLGEAATQTLGNGGAGLSPKEFASLFFHQAMAIQLVSGTTYAEPFTAITPPEAKTAYLRAAVLGYEHDDASLPPLVEASWRLALATIAQRPAGTLSVRAHPRALVSVDGEIAQPSPATFPSLRHGEHFVHVEEAGHVRWSTVVVLQGPSLTMDVPATQFLTYDAAMAAGLAKAHGATFALIGQLHLGDKVEIDLRLVDARTGELRDTTAVPLATNADSPELVAAVLRLDEMAVRADLTRRATGGAQASAPFVLAAPPPRIPGESEPGNGPQPQTWLHQRWPLVTAIALAAGTALVLGIVVAHDDRTAQPARP